MRIKGIEPLRCYHRQILSLLRLPVPPHPQVLFNNSITITRLQDKINLYFDFTCFYLIKIKNIQYNGVHILFEIKQYIKKEGYTWMSY